ncbi:MAG: thermopsin family protease, partial [Caldivirga sp.]
TVNTTKYGVVVNYGYALFRLGNIRLNPVVHWVAHQVIPIPNATAYLITSLNPGPYYMPMDTELVVGGPGNSGGVMFRSLSAQLALYYWNGTSWAPYPVTYTFGASTGEYAVNVSVEPIGPANVELSTGPNNYQVLS